MLGDEANSEAAPLADRPSSSPTARRYKQTVDSAFTKKMKGHDGNFHYCKVCNEVGDVVCCDGCPHVYHPQCLPEDSDSFAALDLQHDDDPWYCPDCVKKRKLVSSEKAKLKKNKKRKATTTGSPTNEIVSPYRQSRPKRKCSYDADGNFDQEILLDEDGDPVAVAVPDDDAYDEEDAEISEAMMSSPPKTPSKNSSRSRSPPSSTKKKSKNKKKSTSSSSNSRPIIPVRKTSVTNPKGESNSSSAKKKDKKKKKKKQKKEYDDDNEGGNSGGSDDARNSGSNDSSDDKKSGGGAMISHSLNNSGMVKAVPAFYFFLNENRNKIDRNLSRKHRYFNRLPKANIERNQLIAKEGIVMWSKLNNSDIQRYIEISMKDFERRIIEWKEEKTLRQMFSAHEEGLSGNEHSDAEEIIQDRDLLLEDDRLTNDNHQRLYLSTTVGFKPYKPDMEESNNRILLELLQDTRFHPLPMIQANRSAREYGEMDFDRITIPYFDINGPVSTCIGDECLGCSRGWTHFCNVLKRRVPAVARRAKLQPPLSSLVATRIGLGLKNPPLAVNDEDHETENGTSSKAIGGIKKSSDCNVETFSSRDIPSAAAAKALPLYPWEPLSSPTERADDIVRFVEEAVCMKIPEPPRPGEDDSGSIGSNDDNNNNNNNISKTAPAVSLSSLSLTLPTRGRKRQSEEVGGIADEEDTEVTVNKCGRCRTIIEGDTGCVPCRRAQLVINMSRGEGQAGDNSKILRVQTNMLGRLVMRDGEVDAQGDGDEAVSNHILRQRWTPFAILPPTTLTSPIPMLDGDSESDTDEEDSEIEEELEESMDDGTDSMEMVTEKDSEALNTISDDNMETEEESSAVNSGNEEDFSVQPSKRLRASSRIEALESNTAISNATSTKVLDVIDRSTLIKKFKEEASTFQKKCVSIACNGLLLGLTRRDPLLHFAEPVEAEGYHDIIHEPMDFGKIKKKVFRDQYATLGAFVSDARLLCNNALVFNPPDSIYYKTAKELSDVLTVMQKRSSKWINTMKDAHAATFNNIFASKSEGNVSDNEGTNINDSSEEKTPKATSFLGGDPFARLRKEWPEAVEMFEDTEWLDKAVESDFMRTKENESAYYGVLAIRRAALAAAASLAPYTDSGGKFNTVGRRTFQEDEKLRSFISEKVAEAVGPPELKEIPTWREEMIMRVLRKSQARRMEGRMGSTHGCARCDGVKIADPDSNKAMNAVTVRWGRTRKKPNEVPRIHKSRLGLSTGLGSQITRDRIQKHKTSDIRRGLRKGRTWALVMAANKVNEVAVTARGSRIHGMGLFGTLIRYNIRNFAICNQSLRVFMHYFSCRLTFSFSFSLYFFLLTADQPLQKGDIVAEYVGEYVSPAVTDTREKIYQSERIQDYQFRIDSQLVIDATKRGGHGRYANHNCNPNCATKIIPFELPKKDGNGVTEANNNSNDKKNSINISSSSSSQNSNSILKRVVIVAQRDIEPMEELTYDYQFPLEVNMNERIPCNCSSELCRGFMNWDLPEKGAKNQPIFRTQKRGANMRDRIRRLGRPLKGDK
jgi:hypothetical protein